MHTISTIIERLICTGIALAQSRRNATPEPSGTVDPTAVTLGHSITELGGESAREVVLTQADRGRHVHILGATGVGKSNVLLRLVDSDLANGRSVCIIDLRGDLLERVYRRLAAIEDFDPTRLLIFDLRERVHTVGFNPLAGSGEPHARAFHLLSIIQEQAEGWGVQLEETLRNALLVLAHHSLTLAELEPLLMNAEFRASQVASVEDGQIRAFFDRFDALSPERQVSFCLPVLNKITPFLAIPTVRAMLGSKRPINLARHLDKPGSITLISLAVDQLHSAAYLMGGMFISAIQSAMLGRIDTPEGARNGVSFYVDEFENLAGSQFEQIIAEGRRFGVSLTLSHQNLHQLPNGLKQCIRNNVHTSFFFQTGFTDASEVCKELSLGMSRDEACTALMNLAVGEAFVVRRGETSERVQTLLSKDPKVTPQAIEGLKKASFECFAQSQAPQTNPEQPVTNSLEIREENPPKRRRSKREHA